MMPMGYARFYREHGPEYLVCFSREYTSIQDSEIWFEGITGFLAVPRRSVAEWVGCWLCIGFDIYHCKSQEPCFRFANCRPGGQEHPSGPRNGTAVAMA